MRLAPSDMPPARKRAAPVPASPPDVPVTDNMRLLAAKIAERPRRTLAQLFDITAREVIIPPPARATVAADDLVRGGYATRTTTGALALTDRGLGLIQGGA